MVIMNKGRVKNERKGDRKILGNIILILKKYSRQHSLTK